MKLLSLPNIVSLLRLPLAVAFFFTDSLTGRAVILVVVALTDLADGFLARRMPSHDRRAGQIVDPITDKLFVLIALLVFALRGDLSVPLLLVLLARDLFTSIAFLAIRAAGWRLQIQSRFSGKLTTVLQLAVLGALLFWPFLVLPLTGLVAVASLVAIADYTRAALRQRFWRPADGR